MLCKLFEIIGKVSQDEGFVAANICLYFSPDEISELLKALALEHINFLMLENSEPQRLCDGEKLYVVDNDLCVIDDGDT